MSRKKGRGRRGPREPERPLGAGGGARAAGIPPRGPRVRARLTRAQLVALLAVVGLMATVALLTVRRPRSGATSPEPFPAANAVAGDSVGFEDFVGSEACAACHAAESASWQRSTHAAAGGAPGTVRMIAPFDGSPIRFSDAEVTPRASGGRVSFTVRQAGEPDRVYPVDAVIGGGHLEGGGTQGFVTRHADGTYRFLPFDYSRHGATWFCNTIGRAGRGWVPISTALSIRDCVDWPPTRVLGDEPRFSNCQSCHGSQIEVSLDTTARAYRTRFRSLAIGCESCHGPGRRHVALVRDSGAVARGDIDMTALATLSKDASLGVCWRCHALKDRLRGGYLPGAGLERHYSLHLPQLGDAAHFPDGRVRTFAYQQGHLWSDCYLNGGMTCTSCHDPHSQGYRDVAGRALSGRIDDRQCTGCHASKAEAPERHTRHTPGSPGSACVSCHMPYQQQPELGTGIRYARSDHSIAIPRPAYEDSLGILGACRGCHADRPVATLEARVREWHGVLKPRPSVVDALARAREARTSGAAARLVLLPGERHVAALFTGMAWFLEQHLAPDMSSLPRDVIQRLRALARHDDLDVQALALASLHFARGTASDVRAFLVESLRALHGQGAREDAVRARWALVLGYLGDRSRARGDPLAAIATYRKAREVDTRNAQIPVNQALAEADAGNLAAAIASYEASLAMSPAQPLTLVNLGIARAARNDLAGAVAAYRRALSYDAREPLAWFNLGGALARRGAPDSALASFRRAAELDPSLSLARFLAARLLLERGDAPGALREIESGLRFDPGNGEARAMRDRLRRELGTRSP
ncbi:MAG TPA: tetratricopeptide repeat protein [Gemmatimonadaceae bacterium]|nr:tetratricopeptide repeat protein [Gemmatimonadaceae bacterium]